ncbi:MAG: hypothetical protein ACM3NS_01550 [Deltaproteobacteria bacterium]
MRALLACLLLVHAASLAAQDTFDQTLSVQQGGKEIGQEDYSVRPGSRTGAVVITARSRYPATNPTTLIRATQERASDGGIAKFELDVQQPEGNVIILAAGSGARLIVRSVSKGAEAGRELPGGRDIVLLDDRVFSLYLVVANAATTAGTRLTAVYPRTGRRATIIARRESGPQGATIKLSGDVTGTLTVDGQGRLQRLDLPSAGILVTPAAK